MKNSFKRILTLFITVLTLSALGTTVLADEEVYENIKDGEHKITAKALNKDSGEASGAAGFISEEAYVTVKDGKVALTIVVPHNDMAEITGLQVEGIEPKVKDGDSAKRLTYKLERLKSELDAEVQYEVPSFGMKHDVGFKFVLEGLDDLPVVEEDTGEPETPGESDESEDPENPEEDTEDESDPSLIELDEGFYTMNASYLKDDSDDSSSMGNYLAVPIFAAVKKDGKVSMTITVNENETVTKLQINGQDADKKIVDGEKRYEIFEFDSLSSIYDAYVEYQAPYNGDIFEGQADFRISLDKESIKQAEASDQPGKDIDDEQEEPSKPETVEVELGKPSSVNGGDKVTVNGDKNIELILPEELPDDVKVTIASAKDNIKNQGDLEIAGEVYDFDFGDHKNSGTFELVMGYDTEKFSSDEVDIYYYDEQENEWIAQEGTVKDGKISIETDHFSIYGVFAKNSAESEEQIPENAEEVDYVIKHKDGIKDSNANDFFEKPALLFEKDGKTYVQLTITDGDMIKELSSEFGEAVVVKKNKDGSIVVQFRVNDDLSDTLLNMHIVVPGLYDSEHEAIFVIKPEDDMKEDPKEDPKEPSKPKEDPKEPAKEGDLELTPDHAYEIDYVIKHEDGIQDSTANDFFEKPALILEKDGKKYVQLTINNGDMVKELSTEYGDAIIIKRNDDGSIVVQLRVNDDLSDTLLKMRIIVPGLYDTKHKALLVFDKNSMKETPIGDHKLKFLGDKENGELLKPEFGDSDKDQKKEEKTVKPVKTDNPQTGDTSSILLYVLLLIGSFIPLAVKLKKRFV